MATLACDPQTTRKRWVNLAVQNTGRSDSGSDSAIDEQRRVITVSLEHGASGTDIDANGKTVMAAATSEWTGALLEASRHLY